MSPNDESPPAAEGRPATDGAIGKPKLRRARPSGTLARSYRRSRTPLYLQVAAVLRRRIEDGLLPPNARMASLGELEAEFQVARVTVRQAIDLLQTEGLVWRQQGKGTFVARDVRDKRWLSLAVDMASLVQTIEGNVPRFMPVDVPPPPRIRPGEGNLTERYKFLRSIQHRNGEPFGVVNVHIAESIFERAPEAFQAHTALPILFRMEKANIGTARQTLVISSADTEVADYLRIALNAPTVEAHCVVTDHGKNAIYIAEIVYRGDRVKLDIDLLQPRSLSPS